MGMQEHKNKLKKAVAFLFRNDAALLEKDVNERTISAKLALYLSSEYTSLNVDCEYNRKGDEVKRLPADEESRTDDTKGKTIFPDIIVHNRGDDTQNEVIIEIKKEGNNDTERDIKKLKALTSDSGSYSYKYGFHLIFSEAQKAKVDVYQNGEKVPAESFEIPAPNLLTPQ